MKKALFSTLLLAVIGVFLSACSQSAGTSGQSSAKPAEASRPPVIEAADDGYDVTAYFGIGKAVRGVPQLSLVWNGATYLFSSEENRSKFSADPSKYIPGFGSHCPVSLSKGKQAPGRPTIWRVYKDKLYFFNNEEGVKEFDKDPEGVLKRAGRNAPQLIG